MHLLSALIFAVSASADSLAVGTFYGLKRKKVGWGTAVFVSVIIFFGTFLSMAVGKSVLLFIPEGLAGVIGGAGILLVGIIGCFKSLIRRIKEQYEDEKKNVLSLQDAATVGLALTFNNSLLGIGAGITGMNVWFTALASFACGLVFLYFGSKSTRLHLPATLDRFIELAGNLLMVGLGIFEIFI